MAHLYIYIYICDISSLRVNGPSEPGRLRDVCVCQWVNGFNFYSSIAQLKNVKWPRYKSGCGPEGGRGIAVLFQDLGARRR